MKSFSQIGWMFEAVSKPTRRVNEGDSTLDIRTSSLTRRIGVWASKPLLAICWLSAVGCAVTPYRVGHSPDANTVMEKPVEIAIAYGQPHKMLDDVAWVVGLPTRLLPMHANVNNHKLSRETADKLKAYLRENDLTDVYVRVNQYDPSGEWRRLRENTRIAPGWRYSVGAAGLIAYSVLPGRVFGGDLYNPFTNSLYINSDVPAVVLMEAAYAKDINSRRLPGVYATVNELPVLSLWRHTHAINDVLGYARAHDDWDVERETYRVVYPQMGVHAALGGHSAAALGTAMPLITIPIIAVGGAIAGHAVGQATIAKRVAARSAELHVKERGQEIQQISHTKH